MPDILCDQLQRAIQDKEHIIWDWNGTLLDDVDHSIAVVNSLLADHQLPLIDRNQYRNIFDFPVFKYYEKLGFNLEKAEFENLCHQFVDRFMLGVKKLPLMSGAKSVLMQLHDVGRVQSVLSATDQDNLESMINHFELSSVFRFVFGIENKFAHSKIQRGHELIQRSQIPTSKTVIVGDTLHDLEVANALGVDAVLISHGHQCPTRLLPYHDRVIPH